MRPVLFESCSRLAGLGCREAPDSASLSFASPKESKQRKGDPQSGALRATCEWGQKRGSAQTRLRLKQRAALIPLLPPFTGPARTGLTGSGTEAFRLAPESDRENPFCMRRGAEGQTDQGPRLSEALAEFERDPGWTEHRRLPVAQRRDADSRVAFSLVTFFWRSKRKLLAVGRLPTLRARQTEATPEHKRGASA